jgi:hypothetical protein
MMPAMIPTFLLKKLYVQGSFKNTSNGFQLSLRNTLAPGTLLGFSPLAIDGRDIPLDHIFLIVNDGTPRRASEISITAPSPFPLNGTVTIRVEDQPLAPGAHRVTVQVETREAGSLKIDAEDTIE